MVHHLLPVKRKEYQSKAAGSSNLKSCFILLLLWRLNGGVVCLIVIAWMNVCLCALKKERGKLVLLLCVFKFAFDYFFSVVHRCFCTKTALDTFRCYCNFSRFFLLAVWHLSFHSFPFSSPFLSFNLHKHSPAKQVHRRMKLQRDSTAGHGHGHGDNAISN